MFWKNKNVFVTGHMGFKGGWLSLWLQQLGATVTGYGLPTPSQPTLFDAARVGEDMHSISGDVRNLENLKTSLQNSKSEVVFHLAAQSLVRPSYADPVSTFESNVMGTVNLLEAVRHSPTVRAVVIVTSDKCYENREWLWGYRENEAMGGFDPYSASKGAAEIVTSSYRRSFFHPEKYAEHGVAIASARAGNVIGGGDWGTEKLIPDIVRAFAKNELVSIRSPLATRPWQHALEALYGYMLLAEDLHAGPRFADAWNFGPGDDDTQPVSWIVAHMAELWGNGANWQQDARPAPHEATLLKLDSSKARTLLGWKPCLRLPDALDWTVSWYQAHGQGKDMKRTTLEQIQGYNALIDANKT